jgi:hypothetical protein
MFGTAAGTGGVSPALGIEIGFFLPDTLAIGDQTADFVENCF